MKPLFQNQKRAVPGFTGRQHRKGQTCVRVCELMVQASCGDMGPRFTVMSIFRVRLMFKPSELLGSGGLHRVNSLSVAVK
jgi:hypothetical protein